MSTLSRNSAFAGVVALATLSLGSPACAQSVPYWTTTAGFGSALTFDPNANHTANFSSRYNFDNGWFIGNERGNLGFGANSFTPVTAFGNPAVSSFESVSTGYNFQGAPVSVYAGLDTLRYNSPLGSPFAGAGLDSMSSNSATGYGVHAGVEIRPTSNLSLSFGASFAQQPSDLNSALLPGASPLAFGRRY